MRKLLPLTAVGCITIIILGLIIGGAGVLIYGAREFFSSSPKTEAGPRPREVAMGPLPAVEEPAILKLARDRFKTKLKPPAEGPRTDLEAPGQFGVVTDYKTPLGAMKAYQSNVGKPTGRVPAIVWAHAGFKGIGPAEWKKVVPFAQEQFLVFVPSF